MIKCRASVPPLHANLIKNRKRVEVSDSPATCLNAVNKARLIRIWGKQSSNNFLFYLSANPNEEYFRRNSTRFKSARKESGVGPVNGICRPSVDIVRYIQSNVFTPLTVHIYAQNYFSMRWFLRVQEWSISFRSILRKSGWILTPRRQGQIQVFVLPRILLFTIFSIFTIFELFLLWKKCKD